MNGFKNMELIENHLSGRDFSIAGIDNTDGYQLRKIYFNDKVSPGWLQQLFPATEVVQKVQEITMDNGIALIIVAAPEANDINMLAEIVRAGKHVRIV